MSFSPREGYQIHVPEGSGPHPAIVFLHGYGESGEDNEAQLRIGLPTELDRYRDFVVVAPQKPTFDDLWPVYNDLLSRILREVEAAVPLSGHRVLTGLSQGGNGTLMLARSLPWTFAGLVAVCGWADPVPGWSTLPREARGARMLEEHADPDLLRENLGGLPLWLLHGEDDPVVPASRSREVAEALPGTRLTLYPGVGHDSWTKAYAEPELPAWMRAPGHGRAL